MPRMRHLVLLFFLLCLPVAADPPAVFGNLTFPDAKARAAEQKRWLLVDCMAQWCKPCKQMEQSTWVDPAVVAYCQENLVTVQVDVDQQPELSEKLKIQAMPTLILFDGEREVDRIQGSRDAKGLLEWLALTRSGQTEVGALEAKAKAGDFEAHMRWADALVSRGKLPEATEQYVWLWDNMLEKSPAHFGVRHSFFLGELQELVQAYPPARQPFVLRFAELHKAVQNGASDLPTLTDWFTLSKLLDDGESVFRYALKTKNRKALRPLEQNILALLTERKLWQPAGTLLVDPPALARDFVAQHKRLLATLGSAEARRELQDYASERTRLRLVDLYHVCRAAGREAEAKKVRALSLQHDSSKEMKDALLGVDALFRGKPKAR